MLFKLFQNCTVYSRFTCSVATFSVLDLQMQCVSSVLSDLGQCGVEDVHEVFAKHLALSITMATDFQFSFEDCPGRFEDLWVITGFENYLVLYFLLFTAIGFCGHPFETYLVCLFFSTGYILCNCPNESRAAILSFLIL